MTTTNKIYTIPLRKSFQKAAPLKRSPRAIRAVKAFLIKHCKVEDAKLGKKLNELIWAKGITNPPAKVKVTVIVDNGVAKAELEGFKYEEVKKIAKKKEALTLKEKIQEKLGSKEDASEKEEKTVESTEKPHEEVKASPAPEKKE